MSQIKGLLREEQPREKLITKGPQNLTQIELLAILLRTGTKDKNVLELSREILNNFSIEMVSRKTYEELIHFNGIKEAKASQIIAAFELARRLSQKEKNISFNSAKDVFNYVKDELNYQTKEYVYVLFVNTKNKLIKKEILNEGSLDYSIIDARLLIKKALDYNASGFFLIHNHPSGDPTPSGDDKKITQEIKEITCKLNIRFLDHIVVGETYFSFFEEDLL